MIWRQVQSTEQWQQLFSLFGVTNFVEDMIAEEKKKSLKSPTKQLPKKKTPKAKPSDPKESPKPKPKHSPKAKAKHSPKAKAKRKQSPKPKPKMSPKTSKSVGQSQGEVKTPPASSKMKKSDTGGPDPDDANQTPVKTGTRRRKFAAGQEVKDALEKAKGECRPAEFGKPPKKGPTVMAKAGAPVVTGSPSKDKKRKRKQSKQGNEAEEQDDDQMVPVPGAEPGDEGEDEDEAGDDETDGLFPGRIRRKGHKRQCQRRQDTEASDKTVIEKACKNYLSAIGISWPEFQKIHRRPMGA